MAAQGLRVTFLGLQPVADACLRGLRACLI
jgi:hypothetical protein